MSSIPQRSYTKEQKKQLRKGVYNVAKKYKKQLEDQYLPNPNATARLEILFPEAIMEAEFKISLEIHRRLQKIEKQAVDRLVFDKTGKYTSENARIGCSNVQKNLENRKALLKFAMECDAMVGYWQLSE